MRVTHLVLNIITMTIATNLIMKLIKVKGKVKITYLSPKNHF